MSDLITDFDEFNSNDQVSRKAILIVCPGQGEKYLEGAIRDVRKMRIFLQTAWGGDWDDEEILVLNNPSTELLGHALDEQIYDYTFVYFAGHGYTGLNQERMIKLNNDDVPDTFLLNFSPKQLVIIDACRTMENKNYNFESILNETVNCPISISKSRVLFNKALRESEKGKMIVHSAESGMPAHDSPKGGFFTRALVYVCARLGQLENTETMEIEYILGEVCGLLFEMGVRQRPTIAYQEGNPTFPLGLSVRPIFSYSN